MMLKEREKREIHPSSIDNSHPPPNAVQRLKILHRRRAGPRRRRRDSLAFGTWLILGSRSPAGGRIFLSQTIIMTKKNCPILGGIRLAR